MDPLSDIISLLEPRAFHVGGFDAGGDWSMGFEAHTGIKCYAITAGQVWLAVHGADVTPVLLQTGDCFLLPHGLPFRLCSDLQLPVDDWRVHLLGRKGDGLPIVNGGGETIALGGHFIFAGLHADMLIGMLSPIVHLKSEADRDTLRWAVVRMGRELADPRPGHALIVQQLAAMVLIQALRLHLEASKGVGWLYALSDRRIGAALGAIHETPGKRWTVQTLASEVGMSRSSFAARFRQLVGDGPIEYLTRWRMLLAQRSLLLGNSVGSVSRTLGYTSESAFNSAFKRVIGNSPGKTHKRESGTS